ncbi:MULTISPECIES: DotA/TraY family protein [Pseudomonadota]|uniref:Membrane protein n=1 Tax=Pandoraea communis TaxID=2508297 RepID=A0A5E4VCJ3_9BURK|nr:MULTISPECIES: DotA/TraY family protein [Pseudomonadota]AVE35598.1 type IV secretion system protein DotA-like protein [Pseudomonas aeruginosa]MBG3996598.1 DotA/TraY family protein [Pseudomonas aeruginosa]MBG6866851.1 DotA/TraY family protein [Pseudomonas aeruginosa]MBI8127975.1 DotA/TraY family protein [Pseudomonas aeruginosa]MCC0249104.1 DotA/TraY family protein [Pseudomonas aeruginosa]
MAAAMPFSPCDDATSCTDHSVDMLRSIFGPVIDALVTGADPDSVSAASNVIATMMSFFNSGILIVGTLIVSYVAAMGTINTANDGEAMGRNWSSLWTPVRIVAGGAVLLPTASGYSFIQLVVLMFALWGVGFANGTYKTGMAIGVLSPDGVVQGVNDPGSFYGLRDFGKQYLAASYCARAANQIYPGAQVSAAPSADKTTTNGGRTEYLFQIKDRNATTNLGGGEPLCGTVSISQYTAQPAKDATGIEAALEQLRAAAQNAKIQAATNLMTDLEAWVNTWPDDISGDWSNVDSAKFNELVNSAETQVAAALMAALSDTTAVKSGFQSLATSLTSEGWAMSGGWYQRVGEVRGRIAAITSESVGSVSAPSLSALPADAAASLLIGSVTTVTEAISKKSEIKGNYKAPTSGPGDLTSVIPKDAQSDINIGSINADFDAKVSLWINSMMESMVEMATGANTSGTTPLCGTAGQMGGSLNRMKCIGDYLTVARAGIGAADVAIKTGATALRVVAGTLSSVKGVGTGLDLDKVVTPIWDWVIEVPVKQLAMMATYIEPMAFYFGVFLPSLPYVIFMTVVVGWILAVLQSLIAAPLWAVMHMTPDRTFVGSQSQGYLLLLSLFARPALAVVGLFAAMLVSDPIIDFIAKGFFAMRGAVVTSTGTVGAISSFLSFAWWFMVFGLTLLPVLYMTFGLPQILPDHVLRWIGAGVSDLGETQAVGQMRSGMAHAASSGALPSGGSSPSRRIGGDGGLLPGGGNGGTPPTGNGGGTRGTATPKRALLSAGDQGVAPSAPDSPAPAHQSDNRSGRQKVSDAAGVGLGRAATGAAGATARSAGRVADAAISTGSAGVAAYRDASESGASLGQRIRAGLTGSGAAAVTGFGGAASASANDYAASGRTALAEGKAAYSEGADARIAAYKESLRGKPVSTGSEVVTDSDGIDQSYDSRYSPPPTDTDNGETSPDKE